MECQETRERGCPDLRHPRGHSRLCPGPSQGGHHLRMTMGSDQPRLSPQNVLVLIKYLGVPGDLK